ARAVAVGAAERGASVHVANRTPERARAVAALCGGTFSGLSEMPGEADVLVNTTPVGMAPAAGETPVPADRLPGFRVVMDIVYAPVETRLLREAAAAGCRVVNGLRMLLYQAAAQFELWTGRPAPAAAMEAALYRGLGEEG
ncbi:shikimate dehydrogenase, partial [Dissulfurirhabdus thermomarina]|nr:shikimate dehydrogenase [Dissulfurirhabdus thermomarina]